MRRLPNKRKAGGKNISASPALLFPPFPHRSNHLLPAFWKRDGSGEFFSPGNSKRRRPTHADRIWFRNTRSRRNRSRNSFPRSSRRSPRFDKDFRNKGPPRWNPRLQLRESTTIGSNRLSRRRRPRARTYRNRGKRIASKNHQELARTAEATTSSDSSLSPKRSTCRFYTARWEERDRRL